MNERIAITERIAAYGMFAAGFTVEEVKAFLNSQRGTCADGYVFADVIPVFKEKVS